MITQANILIADDEAGMREMIALELGELGHVIVRAATGAEAIASIRAGDLDLVITDVRMPGGDGIAVLKAARESAADTEVIVITGYADIDCAVDCVRHGAFDLVHKPFHLVDFLATVHRALDHRRFRATARLYEGCREILGRDGDRPLCERIVGTAMRLLDADDASLMQMDPSCCLRIAYASGIPEAIQREARVALGDRVAGQVALDRTPAILPHALAEEARFRDMETFGRVRHGIAYPLVHGETVLGVLNVNRVAVDRRFRLTDLETAGIVAAQAALALSHEALAQRVVTSQRMAAIGQVAAGVVHEINNPLTFITANVDLARQVLLDLGEARGAGEGDREGSLADLGEMLDDIADGARVLARLVLDMRGLAREQEGVREPFDLSAAVRTALRMARPSVRHVAALDEHLDPGLVVLGSPGRLSQVFLNILVNAAQAIEGQGRSDGHIEVRALRDGARVRVIVADDGPGISQADLKRVLEPFFTTKGSDRGTGLGLAICREIVEEHRGTLQVHSEIGQGATFTVTLPVLDEVLSG